MRVRLLRLSSTEFAAAEAVWENNSINTTSQVALVAALKRPRRTVRVVYYKS